MSDSFSTSSPAPACSSECECLTVTDARQAAAMIHPEFSPLMDALTGREASVGALARELDWPLDTAHYRVKKLLRLGLLRVVREEKRAGRPVKVYRAVADAFFLPYSSFTHATLEEKFLRHELQVARSLVRSYVRLLHDTFPQPGTLGPYLFRDEAGHLQEDLAAAPGKLLDLAAAFPTTTEHLRSLTLTDAEARHLRDVLDALAAEFPRRRAGQPLTHMLRLWLVPAREEDWQ
ncbi:helix-turn-helix domain-containing protein [Deinococcus radiodurans]|uniref:HTH arsR-type domain-containing protein n=1 Tax=Deinococcus radiodurans (strain ATCC 13939 / DSM 20539 / JCM 16871 / CCUG 27074 / LMG 4051 / NBRC 15346 / NCIMB 9279 / VKM B-1422 / R1) TaxID=243230 RepID=Q9RS22_DEIRA|nr:helix-turn-helix domain-containing protein [Deinococcus radiodurans]AAF11855.1 hypothetical protein DR_2305 [Deinococcus radiodurans R1 = ATCC 13939 = DSM 20539]ANC70641.1 hypothetical protein A2G07_02035 [Deinococcus radiodurans R1 = ATCC 13939 = DSM 20539]QEM71685.1 hypothetical protein DXG80_07865 [Deinococcus radiodurans]QIP27977.1 helix-turn-helix domain-containing protein [Deinococcus radiodurans]QIP31141.1 helix-turn-helix domain-containing protein [Deinococcus radiodurans]